MSAVDQKEFLMKEIMDDALGDLANWNKPTSQKSIGPNFPKLADAYYADIQTIKRSLLKMLEPWPAEELTKRFKENNYNGRRLLRDPEGTSFEIVNKIKLLKEREPAWFISGWHVKAVEIDVAHWRAFSSCTLPELTLLSVGLDPRKVNFDALLQRYGHLDSQDKMLGFLEDQYEAIANGLGVDPDNEENKHDLLTFFEWVKKVKFKISGRLRTMLREKFPDKPDTASAISTNGTSQKPKPLHKSSYKLHAILIHSMAVEKYGLNGLADVGRVAKKIQHDTELQGHSPAIRPIRTLLTKGVELAETDNEHSN
ncbi:hypothetical protein K3757_10930 [Sulfitobacter sp. S223]|uniref:hypothetical protein n=1 Tax=Sulfitobacter sp. S223 TaxID=2867023 RepID=UPI0021A7B0A2|nr:hypothetical protein [Sulfitobacter sp. S223]UWR24996.1 hypothetical protein K3757_10930 [Sulfitobacter sp. S223]